jgi:hypothetical protein
MSDVLGRHAYAADAAWPADRARPDWHVAYAYDRWRPTIVAAYSDDTDPLPGGRVRSREAAAGLLLPFRRLRWSETLHTAFAAQTDTIECDVSCGAGGPRRDLRSIRGGWLHDSRRGFLRSIGTEEGFSVETSVETSRKALGADADGGAAILDARAFHRAFGRHSVLAARLAVAASWGPRNARRVFSAGGPGPASTAFDFGRDTIGLLRGFAAKDIVGTRAAVLNLDARVPVLRVQRGAGGWPIFARTIHAAAFVDAGSAWESSFRAGDLRTSFGGELSADVVIIHFVPLTLTAGAAWTTDRVEDRSRAAFFGRVGYAF